MPTNHAIKKNLITKVALILLVSIVFPPAILGMIGIEMYRVSTTLPKEKRNYFLAKYKKGAYRIYYK